MPPKFAETPRPHGYKPPYNTDPVMSPVQPEHAPRSNSKPFPRPPPHIHDALLLLRREARVAIPSEKHVSPLLGLSLRREDKKLG